MSSPSLLCWCDMCGYTASVPPDAQPRFTEAQSQVECPCCKAFGDFSFLNSGAELPEHIAPDEQTPVYPAIDPEV